MYYLFYARYCLSLLIPTKIEKGASNISIMSIGKFGIKGYECNGQLNYYIIK